MSTEKKDTGVKPGSENGSENHPSGAHAGETHEAATHNTSTAPETKPIKPALGITAAVILVVVLALLVVAGILPRQHAMAALEERTSDLAAPSVIAAAPKQGQPVQELVLPGNVTSYTDAPVYARTSGYLTKWYYDIGATVKQGALLAEIASPEVDQQLAQAEADLNTAKANANNAHIQAERYQGLVGQNAVSQQDTDTFVNQAASTSAQVKSAEANVNRLKELTSFEKVYAPFTGKITARRVDIGQLINAGAGSDAELFHMQAVQTLRVYTNLPGIFSASAKRGETIDLTFAELPGKTFQGKLVRTSDAIDPTSRTLLVEVDVDNRKGELLAGTLAQVHFKTNAIAQAYVLPVSALIFRNAGLQVATVNNGIAHLVTVTMGQDDGRTVQIITGLKDGDKVIQDPPDSLIEGEKVHVLTAEEEKKAQQNGAQGGL